MIKFGNFFKTRRGTADRDDFDTNRNTSTFEKLTYSLIFLKRVAVKIRSSNNGKRRIYVDQDNWKEIIKYISKDERHQKKFKFITDIILNGLRNTEIYDKEEVNERCKGVTAMKFFKGQENDRIYCKEITRDDKVFVVIMVALRLRKKSRKLKQKEINIIENVASYEYEFNE